MIRRPPRSTLFPSRRSPDLERRVVHPEQAGAPLPPEGARHRRRTIAIFDRAPGGGPEESFARRTHGYRIAQADDGCQLIEQAEERKSTRLNSSHSQISYAVL